MLYSNITQPFVTGYCMFCAYTRPRYQVSINSTIGPLVFIYFLNVYFKMSLSVRLPALRFFDLVKQNHRRCSKVCNFKFNTICSDKTKAPISPRCSASDYISVLFCWIFNQSIMIEKDRQTRVIALSKMRTTFQRTTAYSV